MALADYDAYKAALDSAFAADFQASNLTATTVAGRTNRWTAHYRAFQPVPANPTTSVALDKTAAQSIGPIPDTASGKLRILGARLTTGGVAAASVLAFELLNHSGGLSGVVTTEQTTNLPTAALTRHTSGEGVMMALVVYTVIGLSAVTVSVSYTNQAGTPGRVSPAVQIGGNSFREAGAVILLPVEGADSGVRSVESVTLSGTTGTAGNFGVILFKPLALFDCNDASTTHNFDAVYRGFAGSFAEFDDDACVSIFCSSIGLQAVSGALLLGDV